MGKVLHTRMKHKIIKIINMTPTLAEVFFASYSVRFDEVFIKKMPEGLYRLVGKLDGEYYWLATRTQYYNLKRHYGHVISSCIWILNGTGIFRIASPTTAIILKIGVHLRMINQQINTFP